MIWNILFGLDINDIREKEGRKTDFLFPFQHFQIYRNYIFSFSLRVFSSFVPFSSQAPKFVKKLQCLFRSINCPKDFFQTNGPNFDKNTTLGAVVTSLGLTNLTSPCWSFFRTHFIFDTILDCCVEVKGANCPWSWKKTF